MTFCTPSNIPNTIEKTTDIVITASAISNPSSNNGEPLFLLLSFGKCLTPHFEEFPIVFKY